MIKVLQASRAVQTTRSSMSPGPSVAEAERAPSQGVFVRLSRVTLHKSAEFGPPASARFPEIHVRPNTDPNQHRFPSTICIPCGSDDKESAYSAGDLGSNLEKGMATHSSILAWKIPWTEEPGGLQSMGLQRVGHDGRTDRYTHTQIPVILKVSRSEQRPRL